MLLLFLIYRYTHLRKNIYVIRYLQRWSSYHHTHDQWMTNVNTQARKWMNVWMNVTQWFQCFVWVFLRTGAVNSLRKQCTLLFVFCFVSSCFKQVYKNIIKTQYWSEVIQPASVTCCDLVLLQMSKQVNARRLVTWLSLTWPDLTQAMKPRKKKYIYIKTETNTLFSIHQQETGKHKTYVYIHKWFQTPHTNNGKKRYSNDRRKKKTNKQQRNAKTKK